MTNAAFKHHRWLIFQNNSVLIIHHDDKYELPGINQIIELKPLLIREHLLGVFDETEIYCAEISAELLFGAPIELLPFRKVLDRLGDDWFTVASKAFTVINWDRNHQFCGRCSSPTEHLSSGFERTCTVCDLHFYPRISPSIIVLIHRDDEILMARSPHFPPGAYGLIAGFIEAGENIEDAVHREIYEEIGIHVNKLEYFGSQVWPFPDALMIGFFAEYHSGSLNIDTTEIEAAGWYRYDQLPGRPSSKISIASRMLDHFIETRQHA